MEHYGALTLLPIAIVIFLALKTKRTLEALLLGTIITYIIIDGPGFIQSWTDAFFQTATSRDNQWVFFVCGLFGSLITLISASHGTLGFAQWLEKRCKGEKSTLMITWLLGILIFIDDYLNIMTLSTCMKRLCDKRKIPREALAYVIDSTGAPVCVLLPFSTWAVFFATLFYQVDGIPELGYGSAMATYLHIIPYIFYAIAALILVPMFIINRVPKLGLMKHAYNRVSSTGHVYEDDCQCLNREENEKEEKETQEHTKGNIFDFLLPIGLLILITIVTGELFYAILGAIVCCFLLYIPRKKLSVSEFCDLYIHGFCNMIPTLAIIFAAFIMQQAMADIGIANYLIEVAAPLLNASVYPVIIFILTAMLTFSTGSSWGIPAICIPILLPIALSLHANPLLSMAALVSGATLGSHACFYSDATVLTSSCCKIQNMEHAVSQIPYALMAAGMGVFGYLFCGICL